jgi:phosphatidylserine decarboxylase
LLKRALSGLNTRLLFVLPHHLLSRLVHHLTRVQIVWLKNAMIRLFMRVFAVDMGAARIPDPRAYPNFNAFFTRDLLPGARPVVDSPGAVAVPVDGTVSQCGEIRGGRLLQAKGIDYSLDALLGSVDLAAEFDGGCFATLYLSPRDYHRIHMPLEGRLQAMSYIPGRLFSVNTHSTRTVNGLFARNERVITLFETEAGRMAMVLVGAIFVSGIETVWHGPVRPRAAHGITHWDYRENPPSLARGAEMGRFNMGSTVIVLFPPGSTELTHHLGPDVAVRMGELLGNVKR